MVLNIDDSIIIDIDKISAITPSAVIVDGFKIDVFKKDYEVIKKAYLQCAKSFLYDKNLKRIRGNK